MKRTILWAAGILLRPYFWPGDDPAWLCTMAWTMSDRVEGVFMWRLTLCRATSCLATWRGNVCWP